MVMAESEVPAVFLVPAAGEGDRFGSKLPKAFVEIAGRPLVAWTLDVLCRSRDVDRVAVAVPDGMTARLQDSLSPEAAQKLAACVPGGETRRESVRNAFRAVGPVGPYVGVHDGVRPFVTAELISRVTVAARLHGAAVPCIQCEDTVKVSSADGFVDHTADRTRLVRVQTPQVFRTELFEQAVDRAPGDVPAHWDEAGLVEAAGHPVKLVEGDPCNLKLTWPAQRVVFETLLSSRSSTATIMESQGLRVGLGFDAHRLSESRVLMLGGVAVEHPMGLEGHSDGDVVCHAVADALLGAGGLQDIGVHFPPGDPSVAGLSGLELLARTVGILNAAGCGVGSVDVVVICESPRIDAHRSEMEKRMADALAIEPEAITVKGTTTEGMGFTGRKEGIAAGAVAVVFRRSGP